MDVGMAAGFFDRVAVLGCPDSLERYRSHAPAPWTPEVLARLRERGFTQVQLNLAWGARPDDEPLNLEDIVEPSPEVAARCPQIVDLNCRPGHEARAIRRDLIATRLDMATSAGLKTLFHFGAPYNRHAYYGDTPPNCLLDPCVHDRYEDLIRRFAADFPGVDDLLVYTYDQDAWLCGEFGGCPRCNGVPLHERLPAFLDRLVATWRSINPAGRVWWEPWELSAGQVHACLERVTSEGFGMALHANIAESMAVEAADPWFIRTARQAESRGIPVWTDWFLGGVSEETEPFERLAHPLTIWRGLRRIHATRGVTGIKEYYGLLPDRVETDANLRATLLFLREPDLDESMVLERLAAPYGEVAPLVAEAMRLASEGMERYPWDCSWMGRQIGRSRTDHALSAAILRPMLCPTPSWESTRGTVYMRTEPTEAHPWMLEDVQLRCQQAADLWADALDALSTAEAHAEGRERVHLSAWRRDLCGIRRRALAYALHLRATMVAIAARRRIADGLDLPDRLAEELGRALRASRANHTEECAAKGSPDEWEEMDRAIADLACGLASWLDRWLLPAPDERSKGLFSLTSC